jgi:uncharacterized protein (UPF0548 family)
MPLTVMAAKMADQLRDAELTYSEAGSTASVLPPGYHHLRRSAVIGSGPNGELIHARSSLGTWWR